MSNIFFKINGYISAGTTILGSWFLLPKKTLELAEPVNPDAGIIEKISLGISVISLSSTYFYQYNRFVKLKPLAKWLIFGFVTLHVIILGVVLYALFKQEGVKDKVSYGISKIVVPIISLGLGIWHIVAMIQSKEDVSAYRILTTINKFLDLADFAPIHEAIKTQPEIYYPTHGIRAISKTAEGATLLVDLTSDNN